MLDHEIVRVEHAVGRVDALDDRADSLGEHLGWKPHAHYLYRVLLILYAKVQLAMRAVPSHRAGLNEPAKPHRRAMRCRALREQLGRREKVHEVVAESAAAPHEIDDDREHRDDARNANGPAP